MTQDLAEVGRKAMGVLAFIHIFIVLVFATHGVTAVTMESVNAPPASSKCKRRHKINAIVHVPYFILNWLLQFPMLGPYTATKAFIGRQTAFISNTLSFGSSQSPTLKLQNLASGDAMQMAEAAPVKKLLNLILLTGVKAQAGIEF